MKREEFLARCGNAYDAGLISDEQIVLLDRWIDFVLRFEGGQMEYVTEFLESERERLGRMSPSKTLANDGRGCGLVQFAAILRHPCQICATDPKAWRTRSAFCPHKGAA